MAEYILWGTVYCFVFYVGSLLGSGKIKGESNENN